MNKFFVTILLIVTIFPFSSVIGKALKSDKIRFESYLETKVVMYYADKEELIGELPITLNKKDLKWDKLVFKSKGMDDLTTFIPVKDFDLVTLKPIESAKITGGVLIQAKDLLKIKFDTYELFMYPEYSRSTTNIQIGLQPVENSISSGTVLGVVGENRFVNMIGEGVAYDPTFGTKRNLRSLLCDALHINSVEVNHCEKIAPQQLDLNALHRRFVSMKPIIKHFSFRTINYKSGKSDFFTYGYFNVAIEYRFSGKDSAQNFNLVVSNFGHSLATDPNQLFRKAFLDNITILSRDSLIRNFVDQQNNLFKDEFVQYKIFCKSPPPNNSRDLKEVIKECKNAVVTVRSGDKGFGSGFFIHPEGYIITNYHVIDESDDLQVTFGKDTTSHKAKVVRYDDIYDLAIIKIDTTSAPYLAISANTATEDGDPVVAIGTPALLELGQSVSKGIVSGLRKIDSKDYIQTDVSINPGNSGGPLINEKGEVVGVIVMKYVGRGLEGLGFAIPAKTVLEKLNIEYK